MRASAVLAGKFIVEAGREAELLENFTAMTYRVGRRIDGASGLLTVRAKGDLLIEGSITDGFFTFGDQTDPAYLGVALGGDTSTYQQRVTSSCIGPRSEEHTYELQSLMRIPYAVFCFKKK